MKPIIFNTEMVKAILDDRKTMTRRVIKPQPHNVTEGPTPCGSNWMAWYDDGRVSDLWPPYQPGDLLWVREMWSRDYWNEKYVYRADRDNFSAWIKWHPSIHMPRKAARIFLKVKDVRAEQLQEISPDDVLEEGTEFVCKKYETCDRGLLSMALEIDEAETLKNFIKLWDRLNARRGFPWKPNPYVWVIEFERADGGCAG